MIANMELGKTERVPYVSCMYFCGQPLLPPVLTEDRRKDLHVDKLKALECERRLHCNKNLEQCLNELDALDCTSEKTISSIDNTNHQCINVANKTLNLTRETIDVSEYSDCGFKVLNEPLDICKGERDKSSSNAGPPLLRSNSYIVLSPSKNLVEHVQDVYSTSSSSGTSLLHYGEKQLMTTVGLRTDNQNQANSIKRPVLDVPASAPLQHYGTPDASDFDVEMEILKALKSLPKRSSQKIISLLQQHEAQSTEMNTSSVTKPLDLPKKEEALRSEAVCLKMSASDCNLSYKPQRDQLSSSNSLNGIPSFYANSAGSCLDNVHIGVDISLQTLTNNEQFENAKEMNDNHQQLNRIETSIFAAKFVTDIGDRHTIGLHRPSKDLHKLEGGKREWAASKICAGVRGYLVRRLFRTERVQILIRTIRDVLICAIQVQHSENLDESDVELHRRLIHQLTGACFAFHDIFFKLSIVERMAIISMDRQRLKDKQKKQKVRALSALPSPKSDISVRRSFSRLSTKSAKI